VAAIYPETSGRPTGNVLIDTLVWGGSWTPILGHGVTLNWTTSTTGLGAPAEAWTSAEIDALRAALQSWGNIANLSFTNDPATSADLVYFKVSGATMDSITGVSGVLGYHDTPDGSAAAPLQGVFNSDEFIAGNLAPGADGFLTLVHEIGHGLGLAHPHDGGGSGEVFPGVGSNSDLGTYQLNQHINTVMSYNIGWADEPSGSILWGGATGPMALDIAAAQAIYGANSSYQTGDDGYLLPQTNASGTGWNCIWDAAGSDSISNAGASADCVIDLREAPLTGANAGGYVSWVQGIAGGYTVAHGAVVENAIGGAGNDILQGNAAANTLDGGAGTDVLTGGDGSDTYRVDSAADVVTETNAAAAGGIDLVQASVSYALGANLELLTLTGSSAINGTGNSLDNTLTGNAAANRLEAGNGNDTLIGGGGADTLIGGSGADNYVITDALTTIVENAGEGSDTVSSQVSYTLGANVERLALGGSLAIDGTGNELANTLIGNAAANELDGGLGDDTLDGGGGDDTYIVSSTGDRIVEGTDGGTDLVISSLSHTLAANLENLSLTGSADIAATGNAAANVMTGNAGANLLDGAAGADSLRGGAGDDTYHVDLVSSGTTASAEDELVEAAGGGTDTVIFRGTSAVTAATPLAMADHIENYDLGATGTARINLTGNALANTLTGNAGANVLDGGAGADRMYGGDGADIYVVDDAGDLPTETSAEASSGVDTVNSSVSYVLGDHLEKLTLTGSANIDATGNTLNNVIVGNLGANVLNGGSGVDALSGGLGDDTYYVDVSGTGRSLKIEDRITEVRDAGSDTVVFRTAGSLALDSAVRVSMAANIENYDLSGTGEAPINLIGSLIANTLIGNAGANSLDGGGGADLLVGGDGNDIYTVDNSGDVVVEANSGTAGGVDQVYAARSYSLGANLENLTLSGLSSASGTGNALDNVLVGNLAANTLDGGAGDDVLDGGAGIDALIGGSGNDTYRIDHKSDTVSELAGEGIDHVFARATHALSANVENLTLDGRAAINGSGNELDNVLVGNGSANVLDGGAGADLMSGGNGSDTYVVDSLGDVVTETNVATAGGFDLVKASISYVLGDHLEKLTLTGTADIDATGNALRNTLVGNDGANILDGGLGIDNLSGGLGDDTYYVDLVAADSGALVVQDGCVEAAGGGFDTVIVRADAALSLDTALTLLAVVNMEGYDVSATANLLVNLKGNALSNILTGNAAANVLDGGANADVLIGGGGGDLLIGGSGDDLLTGGEGADSFIFDALTKLSGNTDTLTDFAAGTDALVLDKGFFAAFRNFDTVDAGHLAIGASAADADDFLVYNGETLYYDADGSGLKLATPIATLIGVPPLSYTDIHLQA